MNAHHRDGMPIEKAVRHASIGKGDSPEKAAHMMAHVEHAPDGDGKDSETKGDNDAGGRSVAAIQAELDDHLKRTSSVAPNHQRYKAVTAKRKALQQELKAAKAKS